MTRCRLHVFPPEEDPSGTQRLREAFEDLFTESDAPVQATSEEWVSEPFEDTQENIDRVDAFERQCLGLHPEVDVLRTRQQRDVMDGRGAEHDYEVALMLNVTYAIT